MDEIALELLKKINALGYESYIVGGYPRDYYRGIKTDDIDICTNAPMEVLQKHFRITHISFASSILYFCGKKFEVTLFRKDHQYKNHRFPQEITLVDDLPTDLQRRDFIMNTLCIAADGSYVDLLGARDDIDQKIIRTVGNAKEKLCEDVLRMMRAIRFSTVLDFEISEDVRDVILKYGYLCGQLTHRRIKEELDQMFTSSHVEKGMRKLAEYHLDEVLHLSHLSTVKQTDTKDEIWNKIDLEYRYHDDKE